MFKTIFSVLIVIILYDLLKKGYKIIINKFFNKKIEKIYSDKDNLISNNIEDIMFDFWGEENER